MRAIVENVSEVGIALATANRSSSHSKAVVICFPDVLLRNRFPETRPARSGVELRVGTKERISATNTAI